MIDALTIRPPLDELYDFIGKVQDYPISIEKLLVTARRVGASAEVIRFYDSFMPLRTFRNKEELLGCSEQVDIMRAERTTMPSEEELSPEEY